MAAPEKGTRTMIMNVKKIAAGVAAFTGVVLVKALTFGLGWGAGYGAVHAINSYASQPTRQQFHDAMADGVKKVPMPKKIDDITTLVAERVDDLQMVYIYEISGPNVTFDDQVRSAQQADLIKTVCGNSTMMDGFKFGATYRYEYNQDGKLLGAFNVDSCPPPASQTLGRS
jgi:hypothetical protein